MKTDKNGRKLLNSNLYKEHFETGISLEELYGEYLEFLIVENASQYTLTNMESIYSGFERFIRNNIGEEYLRNADLIDEEIVKLYIIDLREIRRNAPSSINLKVSRLHSMFLYAKKKKLISSVPTESFPKQRIIKSEMEVVSVDEFRKVIDSLDCRYFVEVRTKFALHWLWETGCRIGELWNASIRDIDLKEKKWYVPKSKNNTARYVPITEILMNELKIYLKVRESTNPKTDKLIVNNQGKHLNKRVLEGNVKKAFVENSLQYTAHSLRHTFCSRKLNDEKVPVSVISKIVGNSPEVLLKTYSHVSFEDLQKYM